MQEKIHFIKCAKNNKKCVDNRRKCDIISSCGSENIRKIIQSVIKTKKYHAPYRREIPWKKHNLISLSIPKA